MKNKKFVLEWLHRAESNLEIAKAGKISDKVFYEDLCFECQQAVEKSIKAILISIDKKFEKIHNIERLFKFLEEEGEEIPEEIKEAKSLSDYAVDSRYPGDYDPVDQQDYEKALNLAEKVVKWANSMIKKSPKNANNTSKNS